MPDCDEDPSARLRFNSRWKVSGQVAAAYAKHCKPLGRIGQRWTLEWVEEDGQYVAQFSFETNDDRAVFGSSVHLGISCFETEPPGTSSEPDHTLKECT